MVNFLGKIFSAALKTNDALEKGILTGCLRIAKESTPKAGFSLFTGLNNLMSTLFMMINPVRALALRQRKQ